jgi:pimeloyl-ACP methyl ester carboxylesterase
VRWVAAALLVLVILSGRSPQSQADTIGIVLMHGKSGSPQMVVDGLATALTGAGYRVDTPEMCWSRLRIYDRPLLDCMTEVDSAIARLRRNGAAKIVVAGMSMGGAAALAYGARHPELAGVVVMGPEAPERETRFADVVQSVAAARQMVGTGHGNDTASFTDHNVGGPFAVRTTAAIFLSYLDPQGPNNRLENVKRLRPPLLWVVGNADPSQTGAAADFSQAPANPQSRFVTVASAHLGTPSAAKDDVLGWLKMLR